MPILSHRHICAHIKRAVACLNTHYIHTTPTSPSLPFPTYYPCWCTHVYNKIALTIYHQWESSWSLSAQVMYALHNLKNHKIKKHHCVNCSMYVMRQYKIQFLLHVMLLLSICIDVNNLVLVWLNPLHAKERLCSLSARQSSHSLTMFSIPHELPELNYYTAKLN